MEKFNFRFGTLEDCDINSDFTTYCNRDAIITAIGILMVKDSNETDRILGSIISSPETVVRETNQDNNSIFMEARFFKSNEGISININYCFSDANKNHIVHTIVGVLDFDEFNEFKRAVKMYQ